MMDVVPVSVRIMKVSLTGSLVLLLLLMMTSGSVGVDEAKTEALVFLPNDPSSREGDNMTLWCTLSKDVLNMYTTDDLEIVAKSYLNHRAKAVTETPTERKLVESFKKEKLNATTIRLFADSVPLEFDYHVVICHTRDWKLHNMQLIQVGAPPHPVSITEHCLHNWKSFVFKWNIPNHLEIRTTYTSWYKLLLNDNSTSDGYVECRRCVSAWNKTASCNRCEVTKLGLSRGITMNVTAVNRYGSTNTCLSLENMYLYNKPAKPTVSLNLSETIDVNGMYTATIILKPPRHRVAVLYNTTIQCDSWNYEINTFQRAEETSTKQRAKLPAYSQCQIAVKCRSVDDEGIMSIYVGKDIVQTFRTGEGVPRSSVETCSNCFLNEKMSLMSKAQDKRFVVVFFKTLPETEARGKVIRYRVKYWISNTKRDVLTSFINNPFATSAELLIEADNSYAVTIEASTKYGFNETLAPNAIFIPKQSEVLDPVVNLTALEINSTHVQLSWSASAEVIGYTVFWCHSSEYSSTCQSEIQWIALNQTTSSHILQVVKDDESLVVNRFGVSKFRNDSAQFFTSNIAWTSCIFSSNHLSPPPTVRAITSGYQVTLELITTQCPLVKSGYVYAFIVVVSEICSNNSTGDEFRHEVKVDDLNRSCNQSTELGPSGNERYGCYQMNGLKPSTNYVVSVYSVTLAGVSLTNTSINFTTDSVPILETSSSIVVLVFSAIALLLVVVGIYKFIRCCFKFCSVQIEPPKKPEELPKPYEYSQSDDVLPSVKPNNNPSLSTVLPPICDITEWEGASTTSSYPYASSSPIISTESVYNKFQDLYAMARPASDLENFDFANDRPNTPYYDSSGRLQ